MAPGGVMGVLNVTPDSFSDGGRFLDHASAVARGRTMIAEGACIIDVGGESTRPGAVPVGEDEEVARVIPVIKALATDSAVTAGFVRISIDTRHAAVAVAAVAAGATIVNDVSASLHEVTADLGVGWVAMHMRGDPRTMQDEPAYDDVVAEVRDFLVERATAAVIAGVPEVWIDPGIGFGKTAAHNLALVRHVDVLVASGWPVVIGVSRKRFLGELTGRSDRGGGEGSDIPTPTDDRVEASVAMATWGFAPGVQIVRAHDVWATVGAARVAG
ncbi:MAG: dihydropteroate synthase [Actinomycetota bacterium]|nr:dihydropteroate synthase [Actinomycetota bacterium]